MLIKYNSGISLIALLSENSEVKMEFCECGISWPYSLFNKHLQL